MFTLVLLSITLRIQRTRRTYFGDELFFGVGRIAKEAEIGEGFAVEPRRMPDGMHELMVQGGVIRFRTVKAGWARHMQRICRGRVEGSLVTLDDSGPVRHGVHQLGPRLDR